VTANKPILVVPDASVLAEWFLPDEGICPGSERLMADVGSRQVTLVAPPLLMHELANALSVAVKRRRITAEDAVLAWEAFSDLGILLAEPGRHGRSILRLSSLPGVTAYNASYVALAESHRCICYTSDKRLAAALRGHSDRVHLVSEYPLG